MKVVFFFNKKKSITIVENYTPSIKYFSIKNTLERAKEDIIEEDTYEKHKVTKLTQEKIKNIKSNIKDISIEDYSENEKEIALIDDGIENTKSIYDEKKRFTRKKNSIITEQNKDYPINSLNLKKHEDWFVEFLERVKIERDLDFFKGISCPIYTKLFYPF